MLCPSIAWADEARAKAILEQIGSTKVLVALVGEAGTLPAALAKQSELTVFVQLANGSTLSLLGGPLAQVTGNSTLSVSGALVSFVGTGNTLSITNNLCASLGCTNLGGVNVALTGGASAANVSLTNPIKGAGTVNVGANAAAILVSGSGSKVSVGP